MPSLRFNDDKAHVHYMLFYRYFAEAFAKVQEQGAIKYGYGNWRSGGKPDQEYLDSALRHILAHMDGELYDEDCGTLHMAHACWNLINLMEQNMKGVPVIRDDFDQEGFTAKWKDLPKQDNPTYNWNEIRSNASEAAD
jgi:hypothetical protein